MKLLDIKVKPNGWWWIATFSVVLFLGLKGLFFWMFFSALLIARAVVMRKIEKDFEEAKRNK